MSKTLSLNVHLASNYIEDVPRSSNFLKTCSGAENIEAENNQDDAEQAKR